MPQRELRRIESLPEREEMQVRYVLIIIDRLQLRYRCRSIVGPFSRLNASSP